MILAKNAARADMNTIQGLEVRMTAALTAREWPGYPSPEVFFRVII
jgi:hypothetical protein